MKYIYHIVFSKPKGSILYPLSGLKSAQPDTYVRQMVKYKGREKVLDMVIPQLDCTWQDVLHMSAVHPDELAQAFAQVGLERNFLYYQIPTSLIDGNKAVIYKNTDRVGDRIYNLLEEDFAEYDENALDQWAYIPQDTIEHYKERTLQGKHILAFRLIPHVLYKGTIDVSELKLHDTELNRTP